MLLYTIYNTWHAKQASSVTATVHPLTDSYLILTLLLPSHSVTWQQLSIPLASCMRMLLRACTNGTCHTSQDANRCMTQPCSAQSPQWSLSFA
jgi:hypothetical protein